MKILTESRKVTHPNRINHYIMVAEVKNPKKATWLKKARPKRKGLYICIFFGKLRSQKQTKTSNRKLRKANWLEFKKASLDHAASRVVKIPRGVRQCKKKIHSHYYLWAVLYLTLCSPVITDLQKSGYFTTQAWRQSISEAPTAIS